MPTDYDEYSDAQLVRSYQKGEREAGDALFRRYERSLRRFLKQKTRNRENVEDFVQDTCLEALKSLRTGEPPANFKAWLYKIAMRVVKRWREQRGQDDQVSLDAVLAEASGDMSLVELLSAPVAIEPEHGVLDAEYRDIRCRFEKTLRSTELAVFRLRLEEGMPFREIGRKLGINAETAKSHYHRTKKAFKAWLKRHYPDIYDSLSGRRG